MAYVKQTWTARAREFANRITLGLVSGSTYDVTQVEGAISVNGTPFSAARMNYIEDGIYNNSLELEAVQNQVYDNSKAVAELLMIADIDSKVFSPNLNKFYTDFTNTMDYSAGRIDPTKQLYSGTLASGSSSVTVTLSTGFSAGQEVSIQTGTTYEDIILLSVVGNVLNFKTNTTLTHVNPLIYRSNNFKQVFGGKEGKQLTPAGAVFGMHFNGGVAEFVGSLVAESNTGTFVDGLFGTQQIKYNGSQFTQFADGDYFNFGANDFGIGMWLTRDVIDVFSYIFGQANSTTTSATTPIFAYFNANNTILFGVSNGSTNTTFTSILKVADLLPHYYAFIRSSNVLYLYVDNVLFGSVAFSGTLPNSTSKFCIGRLGENTASGFNGKIEEFVIVKGQPITAVPQALEYSATVTAITKNVIRMNLVPYESIQDIAAWLTKTELAGFTSDSYLSVVGSSADEAYVTLAETVDDLGSTEEVEMLGSATAANTKATLKIVLNRASTSDNVSFTKLLGGVS